jgi:hypothetical protein
MHEAAVDGIGYNISRRAEGDNVLGDYNVLANDRNPSAKIEDSRCVIATVFPFDLGVFSLNLCLLLVYLVVGYVVDCLHAWLCR